MTLAGEQVELCYAGSIEPQQPTAHRPRPGVLPPRSRPTGDPQRPERPRGRMVAMRVGLRRRAALTGRIHSMFQGGIRTSGRAPGRSGAPAYGAAPVVLHRGQLRRAVLGPTANLRADYNRAAGFVGCWKPGRMSSLSDRPVGPVVENVDALDCWAGWRRGKTW